MCRVGDPFRLAVVIPTFGLLLVAIGSRRGTHVLYQLWALVCAAKYFHCPSGCFPHTTIKIWLVSTICGKVRAMYPRLRGGPYGQASALSTASYEYTVA